MGKNSCSKCGKEAVIYREHEGRGLCADHFSIDLNKQVKKTVRQFNMVESGDKIAVGLSGGKDSAVLLEQLTEIFGERPDIEIVALAVDEGIHGYRDHSLDAAEDLCEDLEVRIETARFSDYYSLAVDEFDPAGGKSICTYCGILRRDLLNVKAREIEADKIAIGHNLDDEAQSILMNHLRGDTQKLARIGPGNPLDHEKFVPRIKPLRDIPEREVALYSRLHDLGVVDECPYVEEDSLRPMVKSFLNKMEEEMPGVKYSVVSQGRELSSLVDSSDLEGLDECEECGEPCSGGRCRKCQLLGELRSEKD